jgi:predicted dehydrogenase
MKFAIIGLGGRGSTYAHFINYYGSELVAVCDPDVAKKQLAISYGMPEDAFYTDEDSFFSKGKLADALVISTLDDLHYGQTMRALELGYDILLEKPIAMTLEECEAIRDKAIECGAKVVVCHVLRYSPWYNKVKEVIDSGAIGDIVCVELTENIGYYHYAHSFCRGNWRNTDVSTPLILAKNCHDTDMICWLIGKKCLAVNSFGSLKYFKKEYAPEGSTEYCFNCPHKDTCRYNCFYLYNNEEYERIAGLAKHGRLGDTKEQINESLSNPDNLLARCVYRCDNNVADNQIVNMQFEDNIIAQLKSIAFTNDLRRILTIHGTEGMLYFAPNGERGVIVEKLNGEKTLLPVEEPKGGYNHHGGGDVCIISQFIEYIETGKPTKNITDITASVMGHKVAFLAEESRLNSGKTYYL